MKKIISILLTASCLLVFSCGKEGPGGKSAIKGYVKHHNNSIPNAVVYIKYGTKEQPGTDVTYYDASVNADTSAYFEFIDLKRGDYYLFGVGFDSIMGAPVIGGVPVEIKKKTETIEVNVPVTE